MKAILVIGLSLSVGCGYLDDELLLDDEAYNDSFESADQSHAFGLGFSAHGTSGCGGALAYGHHVSDSVDGVRSAVRGEGVAAGSEEGDVLHNVVFNDATSVDVEERRSQSVSSSAEGAGWRPRHIDGLEPAYKPIEWIDVITEESLR